MKLRSRRQFLHVAAGAVALPAGAPLRLGVATGSTLRVS
jgi:hypothetical protein